MQSQPSAPVITTIITNLAHAYRAIRTIHQFCLHASIHVSYILSFFFFKEKGL